MNKENQIVVIALASTHVKSSKDMVAAVIALANAIAGLGDSSKNNCDGENSLAFFATET